MSTAEIENELDGWTIKINNRLKKNYKRNFRTKVIQLPQNFVDEIVDDPGHWLPWLWEATHNKEYALACYIDNLERRSRNQPFAGLPAWERDTLENCEDVILRADLCDVCGVPHGSTVGYSIRQGEHFLDLSPAQI